MLRKINLKYRNVQQELEDMIENGFRPEPIDPKIIKEVRKKAKKFPKLGHY